MRRTVLPRISTERLYRFLAEVKAQVALAEEEERRLLEEEARRRHEEEEKRRWEEEQRRRLAEEKKAAEEAKRREYERLFGITGRLRWSLDASGTHAVALEGASLGRLAKILSADPRDVWKLDCEGDPDNVPAGARVDVSRWVGPLRREINQYDDLLAQLDPRIEGILRMGTEEDIRWTRGQVRDVLWWTVQTAATIFSFAGTQRGARFFTTIVGRKYVPALMRIAKGVAVYNCVRAAVDYDDALKEGDIGGAAQNAARFYGSAFSLLPSPIGPMFAVTTLAGEAGASWIEARSARRHREARLAGERVVVRVSKKLIADLKARIVRRQPDVQKAMATLAAFQ